MLVCECVPWTTHGCHACHGRSMVDGSMSIVELDLFSNGVRTDGLSTLSIIVSANQINPLWTFRISIRVPGGGIDNGCDTTT
jgi:hypothetical protein